MNNFFIGFSIFRRKELVLMIGMLLKIWLIGLILVIDPSNPQSLLKNTGKVQESKSFQSNANPSLNHHLQSFSKKIERENKCIKFKYIKRWRVHACVKFMVQHLGSNITTNTENIKWTINN
uniref:Uncharacterized protein n=1 Tax=Lepeophtheirus salmonis TaxID=72036 RepID=A0A0K2VIS0_LEPSM